MHRDRQRHQGGRKLAAAVLLAAGAILLATEPSAAQHSKGGLAAGAAARQRAAVLDQLFTELKAAPDQEAADAVVARIWQQWTRSGRDDVDVLMSRALANVAGQHLGLSLLLLDEVIDLMPEFAEAYNRRATLYYRMGRQQEALADIERTLQLEPRHFGALAARAAILANEGKWRDALAAYRAALAINPFLQRRARVLPELEKKAGELDLQKQPAGRP